MCLESDSVERARRAPAIVSGPARNLPPVAFETSSRSIDYELVLYRAVGSIPSCLRQS
jgi:hypothetical protein